MRGTQRCELVVMNREAFVITVLDNFWGRYFLLLLVLFLSLPLYCMDS